ncbi:hypothetical protein HJFPF1_13231 [Paramyrothecium foliicola]|nr:hypothetical protein HJFPF1_13231 [Paramyrothecium foliicola]
MIIRLAPKVARKHAICMSSSVVTNSSLRGSQRDTAVRLLGTPKTALSSKAAHGKAHFAAPPRATVATIGLWAVLRRNPTGWALVPHRGRARAGRQAQRRVAKSRLGEQTVA